MDNPFRRFNEIEWRTYETFAALENFERFWREIERLVAEAAERQQLGLALNASNEEEYAEYCGELRVARYLHDEIAKPMLRQSAVVTLFALCEQELNRFAENIQGAGTRKRFGDRLFDDVKECVRAKFDFRLSEVSGYEKLRGLQKVRDCFVHLGGDPAQSGDRECLMKMNSQSLGIGVVDGTPIELEARFLEDSLRAARSFYSSLFARVGWKINDMWQL